MMRSESEVSCSVGLRRRLLCLVLFGYFMVSGNLRLLFADSSDAGQSGPPDKSVAAVPSQMAEPASKEVPDRPLSRRPYRILVEISSAEPEYSEGFAGAISTAIRRMYGEMWDAEVVVSEWLFPANAVRMDGLTSEECRSRYDGQRSTKVMMLTVERVDAAWRILCREYDCLVQELTPVYEKSTLDARAVPMLAAEAMRDAFRPVLEISMAGTKGDEIEMMLQAGELSPPDPSAAQIAPGDVLRPFLRHMNRRDPNQLQKLQPLPLSYIRITEFNRSLDHRSFPQDQIEVTVPDADSQKNAAESWIDRAYVKGVLISHGAVPFGGRARNARQIALRQRPSAAVSRVRLRLKTRPDRPLVAVRVDRVSKLRFRDPEESSPASMISDRDGELMLEVDESSSTCWLYVYSGSLLLARVPYAPGVHASDTVLLPDDSLRLGVEGELLLFRDRLVDGVARIAVAKAVLSQSDADQDQNRVREILKQLDTLPDRTQFIEELNAIRVPAMEKARAQQNRKAERVIEKLCRTMLDSVEEYFGSEKHLQEWEEIQKLREAVAAE
jgi:hypothetical protein